MHPIESLSAGQFCWRIL